jgi:hypothetical protein
MTTTKSTKQRVRTVAKFSTVPLGLLASGALVLGYSNAAFTAQTSNAGNNWSTGSVDLKNNLTTPLFSHTGGNAAGATPDKALAPGDTLANRQIKIDYTGANAADIRLYANLGTDAGNVAQYIDVTINDGASNIYNGTLKNLTTSNPNWASGIGGWTPGSTASKTYTFTAKLKDTAPDSASGQSITGTSFTWEAHAA